MEVQVKRTIDYIPDWNKNKKDKNPIEFHLRYLSTEEEDECMEVVPLRIINAETRETSGGEIIQHDKKRFCYSVVKIKNLQVKDDNKTVEVTTAKELLAQPGFELLYLDVLTFLKKMEARVDSKN